jgi:hypothetical protein
MATRIHRPFKIIAFNANGIGRQRHELSKQLQDLRIDVAFFQRNISNLMRGYLFKIPTFIELTATLAEKAHFQI